MNTQRNLVLIGWRKCQQYRRPGPPWISLYTSLLGHPAWRGLDDAARSLLINLWLYAGQTTLDGIVWGDPAYLKTKLPLNGPVDLQPLLEATDAGGRPFPFVRWEDDPLSAREIRWAKVDAARGSRRSNPGAEPTAAVVSSESARERNRLRCKDYRERKKAERQAAEAERDARRAETQTQTQTQTQSQSQNRGSTCDPTPPAEADECARNLLSGRERSLSRPRETETQTQTETETASQAQSQSQSQSQSQAQVPTGPPEIVGNPASPEPIRLDPPVSDGGGRAAPKAPLPPERPARRPAGVRLLGESLPQALRAMADPLKYEWLAELYRRLGFGYPMDSPLGRQEIGSFASVYDALMAARLPAADKAEILAHDLDWARVNGQKRRNRKRGAVFNMVHNERVATYLARRGGRR